MAKISDSARRSALVQKKVNRFFDLNTDFGQTADRAYFEGKERTLLNYVSSVNIPCGVHDGEPSQVIKDIATAKQNLCAVGAHIAYPDPRHYGYHLMDLSADELYSWVLLQLGALSALCRANDIEIEHVRPHGALYSAFITNEEVAVTVARAVRQFDPWLILVSPISPLVEKVQDQVDLQVVQEVYLGKRVGADGVIILDRFNENLHPQGVIEQVKQLVMDGSITAEDGKIVKVTCKTLHLSPKLQGNMMVAERINAMLGGKPTPLSMVAAGSSGWV